MDDWGWRRRQVLLAAAGLAAGGFAAPAPRPLIIIEAPSNLGLRPPSPGHAPGAWGAPEAYRKAGLQEALRPSRLVALPRPDYDFEPQAGTKLRNGLTLRAFDERLAKEVETALRGGGFPLVIGGDCSVLLGCLAGARRLGEIGLAHIDGHADFRHPGNYDVNSMPGSVAGMDLALATGRGEPLMAQWDGRPDPLVRDGLVVQIGERYLFWPELKQTAITRLDLRWVTGHGVASTVRRATEVLAAARQGFWVHLDVDVMDARLMPAVDSPGRPGLSFGQLAQLLDGLCGEARCLGLDIAIFDPELDPAGLYARALKTALVKGLRRRKG